MKVTSLDQMADELSVNLICPKSVKDCPYPDGMDSTCKKCWESVPQKELIDTYRRVISCPHL